MGRGRGTGGALTRPCWQFSSQEINYLGPFLPLKSPFPSLSSIVIGPKPHVRPTPRHHPLPPFPYFHYSQSDPVLAAPQGDPAGGRHPHDGAAPAASARWATGGDLPWGPKLGSQKQCSRWRSAVECEGSIPPLFGRRPAPLSQRSLPPPSFPPRLGAPRGTSPPSAPQILALADAAEAIFMAEPTCLRLRAPVKIFGDLHGQVREGGGEKGGMTPGSGKRASHRAEGGSCHLPRRGKGGPPTFPSLLSRRHPDGRGPERGARERPRPDSPPPSSLDVGRPHYAAISLSLSAPLTNVRPLPPSPLSTTT